MRLLWQQQALQDLRSLQAYIASDNPGAARRVALAILGYVTTQLKAFPETGRVGRVEGTCELVVPRTPYLVAYRIRPGIIDILAVHHAARRWPDRF
jgi:toxin ParE1/3/4